MFLVFPYESELGLEGKFAVDDDCTTASLEGKITLPAVGIDGLTLALQAELLCSEDTSAAEAVAAKLAAQGATKLPDGPKFPTGTDNVGQGTPEETAALEEELEEEKATVAETSTRYFNFKASLDKFRATPEVTLNHAFVAGKMSFRDDGATRLEFSVTGDVSFVDGKNTGGGPAGELAGEPGVKLDVAASASFGTGGKFCSDAGSPACGVDAYAISVVAAVTVKSDGFGLSAKLLYDHPCLEGTSAGGEANFSVAIGDDLDLELFVKTTYFCKSQQPDPTMIVSGGVREPTRLSKDVLVEHLHLEADLFFYKEIKEEGAEAEEEEDEAEEEGRPDERRETRGTHSNDCT